VPHIITSILVAALVVQILCALVNVWWKISTHTAAIGGVTGGVIAFAFIFNFNHIWWLTLVILLGGLVGSSRMMLRQHTLAQVVCGFLLGMLAVIVTVLT
jgi:membrane-associated phospholipid phosphatase